MKTIKTIFRGRSTGKTTELVLMSAKTGIPIICCGSNVYLIGKAKELNVSIPNPVQYTQAHKIAGGKAYVDDADWILQRLLGLDVEAIAISDERNGDVPEFL